MSIQDIFVFAGFCVPFFLLTVWAVVNAAQKDFSSTGHKALWLIIASVPFLGFIIYFLLGSWRGKKPVHNSDTKN